MVRDENMEDFSFSPVGQSVFQFLSCEFLLRQDPGDKHSTSGLCLMKTSVIPAKENTKLYRPLLWVDDALTLQMWQRRHQRQPDTSESSSHCPVEQGWNSTWSFISSWLYLNCWWPTWGLCRVPGMWYSHADGSLKMVCILKSTAVGTEMFRFSWRRRMWGVGH